MFKSIQNERTYKSLEGPGSGETPAVLQQNFKLLTSISRDMGSAAVEQDSRAATYLTLVLMKLTLVTLTWVQQGTQASNEFPTINVLKEEFAKHAKTSKMQKRPW